MDEVIFRTGEEIGLFDKIKDLAFYGENKIMVLTENYIIIRDTQNGVNIPVESSGGGNAISQLNENTYVYAQSGNNTIILRKLEFN